MQTNEYKEMFYGEAKEHIDKLNNNLLLLEKDPKNHDVINDLFRTFHTLKGNSATMGYEKFSKVAHKLEDVLDLIRNEKLDVTKILMDILFLGCDTLEKGLDLINEDKPEEIDDVRILEELEQVLPNKDKTSTEQNVQDRINLTDNEKETIKKLGISEDRINRIIVTLEGGFLKSAKAMMIIKRIGEKNRIIRITPSENDIRENRFTDTIDILSDAKKEDIETILTSVTKVKNHKILAINESYNFKKKDEAKTRVICEQKEEIKKIQDVRIDIKRLDNLMNMVGELLIYKMSLENINKKIVSKELETITDSISILAQSIQNEVIEERMIPLGSVFSRLPRIVRDLAKEEGKDIDFSIEGEDNSLDRTVIDKITDPLIHMVRNSVDHGIESTNERQKNGKPQKGMIKLVAAREKNKIIISLEDDGAGIDTEKVKLVAQKKGLYTQEELDKMPEEKIQQMIFTPGFSTNDKVTEISGRGVGMNVVETNVKQAGGRVYLSSKKGKGTKINIELPLTMAIISVLLVNVKGEKYAIPLTNVIETLKIYKNQIKMVENSENFVLREEPIPLLRLDKKLGINTNEDKDSFKVIIVESSNKRIGVVVDSIETQQEILIKDIDHKLKKINGIGGGTILGDGKVCFILDVDGLLI